MWRGAVNKGHRLASLALSVLYPSRCPVCSNPADTVGFAPFCLRCWKSIERYSGPSCAVCALPVASGHALLCSGCFARRPDFSSAFCFGLYAGALREAISLLKFSGIRRLARPLGKLLTELPVHGFDGIVPVPVTKRTLKERGFNHTVLLGRVLSRSLDIPLLIDLLYKKRETPPQVGLGAKERLSNVRNVFGVSAIPSDRRLILLDDVMTTGATVRECSRTLVEAGAKEVVVVTLARAASD